MGWRREGEGRRERRRGGGRGRSGDEGFHSGQIFQFLGRGDAIGEGKEGEEREKGERREGGGRYLQHHRSSMISQEACPIKNMIVEFMPFLLPRNPLEGSNVAKKVCNVRRKFVLERKIRKIRKISKNLSLNLQKTPENFKN
jgi:hypothetical protein